MYLTRGGSVQRSVTSGPRGLPAGQLLCWFRAKLHGHVSTQEGEGQGGEESQWRLNSLAGRPRGLATRPPLGELPPPPCRWNSPHGPINTPYRWKSEHTPHFGDSTCKALIS
jgi:hypothetical protein